MKLPLLAFFIYFSCNGSEASGDVETSKDSRSHVDSVARGSETMKRLKGRVEKIKAFVREHGQYNSNVVFLVDMRMPSGKYCFFVYDLVKDSVLMRGLVAHGFGSNPKKSEGLQFSNVCNSYCTSLGKYAVGEAYPGRFGMAYKLYGLEASNSNALKRAVVLHRYNEVPGGEQEDAIVNSAGCLMVAPGFMKKLIGVIDGSEKRILLEIYY